MIFTWSEREPDGRTSLSAQAGEYDGVPPIDKLFVDQAPLEVHDDVLAVAATLLFGEYCSGDIEFSRKISPEVAVAISRYLNPVWVQPGPIEFASRANTQGEGTLLVNSRLAGWGELSSVWGEPRRSTVCVLPSSEFTGSIISSDGMAVASNANLIGAYSARKSSSLADLAVGLMYIAGFRANSIVLGDDDLNDQEFLKLHYLLASCKVRLLRKSELM